MEAKIVSGNVVSFDDEVNEAIKELEREGREVLDIKFSSTSRATDKHYALYRARIEGEDQPIPFAVASAIAELWAAKRKDGVFRIKAWIPAEVDPKEDMQYTREDAEKEKAQLEEMQPENKYEIEEVDEK